MSETATEVPEGQSAIVGTGFDSPVSSRYADFLNRWPLARQVYNVAVNGPADWSVRVGVYGEWGTGKTSILKFVESMATDNGHAVVWFDPWAYNTKAHLWHSFVSKIGGFFTLINEGSSVPDMKGLESRIKTASEFLVGAMSSNSSDHAVGALTEIEAVRQCFEFIGQDLADLKKAMNGKRVVILIDDLDRTSAELVPEILFALKEIMDVPSFSFVCGFDPKVVGEVLLTKHKGFEDGLKFLEKIIDYPVWLSPALPEGLKRMAEADAKKYCPVLPATALRDVFELLPQNPRSVRQFIRITSLLKTQTDRHGDDELNWPIILTANAIKVRFPTLERGILHSEEFYRSVRMGLSDSSSPESRKKRDEVIHAHVEKCLKQAGINDPTETEAKWMQKALLRICQHLDIWMGEGLTGVVYQSNLAERPAAVTGKEFESFLNLWKSKKSVPNAGNWISAHAEEQGTLKTEVACDLVTRLVTRLKKTLQAADAAFTEVERRSLRTKSKRLQLLLEEIALHPDGFDADLSPRSWLPIGLLIQELVPLVQAMSPVHAEVWLQIDPMLTKLVTGWDANFEMLLEAVRSISPHRRHSMDGAASFAVARRLNQIVDDRLSKQVVAGMETEGFVGRIAYQREGTKEMEFLIRNSKSQLWEKHRSEFIGMFKKTKLSSAVRGNAYAFLDWIEAIIESKEGDFKAFGKALAGDREFMPAVWEAAISKPFLARHAYKLRKLPTAASKLGVSLDIPDWWQPAIDAFTEDLKRESRRNNEPSSGIEQPEA